MILDLLLIALVITLEPIPLTAFLLVLMSKGGVRKGAAFIFGWLLSLAVVVALTLVFTGNKPPKPSTAPSLAAIAVKLLIGVVLVIIALRRRAKMGQPKPPKKPPKWQTGIDNMSPWVCIGLAPLTQPWGLVAAGVATIMEAKLSSWESYIALFLFCVVATAVYLVMEIYAGFRPGAGPDHPAVRPHVDRHPHRPGDHHRLAGPGPLAGREEHLRAGHLTGGGSDGGRPPAPGLLRRGGPGHLLGGPPGPLPVPAGDPLDRARGVGRRVRRPPVTADPVGAG